jgi:DNA-binding SARP family transcriptional activator/TolB-like protein
LLDMSESDPIKAGRPEICSAMPGSVRLNIMGGFSLQVEGGNTPVLPRKARALLSYLTIHAGRAVPREAVGELLWSDRGSEQVRHSLRQTLAVIRKDFEDCNVIISRDGALVLASSVQSDVAPLLQLSASSNLAEMHKAAEAYAGPLLDGFPPVSKDFDDWLTLTRAKLEVTALKVMAQLADAATKSGDRQSVLVTTERMFRVDPLREDTHRRLLEACAAVGRRSEALRYYGIITDILRRELGVSPGRETRDLVQRLRREMDPPHSDTGRPEYIASAATSDGSNIPPIAVMPFRQLSDEPIPSHLAEGLVTDIICQLAGFRELRVISHGTTLGLKDPDLDARSVGRILGVRYVINGAMRRSGRSLRLTTELSDAESGIVV